MNIEVAFLSAADWLNSALLLNVWSPAHKRSYMGLGAGTILNPIPIYSSIEVLLEDK